MINCLKEVWSYLQLQKLMSLKGKIYLRKRLIVETVNDQLKNISQIEHSRHRGMGNFLVNLIAGLITIIINLKNHL